MNDSYSYNAQVKKADKLAEEKNFAEAKELYEQAVADFEKAG